MKESKLEAPTVEITITAEEQELIFSGTRPEGMRYDVFRKVRKDLAKATKLYKGGKYKHISVWTDYSKDVDKVTIPIKKTNTYVRTEQRRHEKLGRKCHNVINN